MPPIVQKNSHVLQSNVLQAPRRYQPVNNSFLLNGRLVLPERRAGLNSVDDDDEESGGSSRVRAPNVDLAILAEAANFIDYFATHPSQSRYELVQKLVQNLRPIIDREYGGNPLHMLAYLALRYKPSTARTYASVMQSSNPALKANPLWQNGMRQMYIHVAENPPTGGATPATPIQVRRLIGDMRRPEQRCVYQLWVTASRYGETIGNTDPESQSEEQHTPRTWEVIRHRRSNGQPWAIQLHLRTSKQHPKGDHPFSKWIRLGINPPVSEQYWHSHEVQYREMLQYVQSIEPSLSMHSFRKGAIQFLEACGVEAAQIALLSGHTASGQYQSLTRSYMAADPHQPEAQKIMSMTTFLSRVVNRSE